MHSMMPTNDRACGGGGMGAGKVSYNHSRAAASQAAHEARDVANADAKIQSTV